MPTLILALTYIDSDLDDEVEEGAATTTYFYSSTL